MVSLRSQSSIPPETASAAILYDTDFMAWCEQQVGALKTRNYDALDLVNLVEEIEELGQAQFNKTKSLTRQVIAHILKLQAFPEDQAASHWQDEIEAFQDIFYFTTSKK